MSAPLKLTADELEEIADALRDLSNTRNRHHVEIGGWGGQMEIRHVTADVVLTLEWNDEAGEYRVNDRVGS